MSIRSVFNPITSRPSVKEQVPTSLNSTANKKGRCPKILGLFRMYLNGGSRFLLTRFDGKNLPEGLERGKLVPAHEYRPQSTVVQLFDQAWYSNSPVDKIWLPETS